jgi:hypothetical protein
MSKGPAAITPEVQIEIAAAELALQITRHDVLAYFSMCIAMDIAGIKTWTKFNIDIRRGYDGDDRHHRIEPGNSIGELARVIVDHEVDNG